MSEAEAVELCRQMELDPYQPMWPAENRPGWVLRWEVYAAASEAEGE